MKDETGSLSTRPNTGTSEVSGASPNGEEIVNEVSKIVRIIDSEEDF